MTPRGPRRLHPILYETHVTLGVRQGAYGGPMEHSAEPRPVPAETRDWSFVLRGSCPECGWEMVLDAAGLRERWDATVGAWPQVPLRDGADVRPDARTWSPLEYAAHTRDMIRLLGLRLASMVDHHDPEFPGWDGDVANVVRRDWVADPRELSEDLGRAAQQTAEVLDSLTPELLERRGHRGDGMPFTVLSLWHYIDHDVEHHLWDVTGRPPH